jgi:hypothetical protein
MDSNKTVTATFTRTLVIDVFHANLSNKEPKTKVKKPETLKLWDLHVWVDITNTSSQTFAGKIKIQSYQPGTPAITIYYYADISITPGTGTYPSGVDYWLLDNVATGEGKPGDVFVEIWIYDTNNNQVAYASRTAN